MSFANKPLDLSTLNLRPPAQFAGQDWTTLVTRLAGVGTEGELVRGEAIAHLEESLDAADSAVPEFQMMMPKPPRFSRVAPQKLAETLREGPGRDTGGFVGRVFVLLSHLEPRAVLGLIEAVEPHGDGKQPVPGRAELDARERVEEEGTSNVTLTNLFSAGGSPGESIFPEFVRPLETRKASTKPAGDVAGLAAKAVRAFGAKIPSGVDLGSPLGLGIALTAILNADGDPGEQPEAEIDAAAIADELDAGVFRGVDHARRIAEQRASNRAERKTRPARQFFRRFPEDG